MTVPPWIKAKACNPAIFTSMTESLRRQGLHTVCESAHCPNIGECWAKRHVTLMILGDRCTRGCTFCGVVAQTPAPPDDDEPRRVATAILDSGLKHVVITSVTRDDLPDGGASHWAKTITAIRGATLRDDNATTIEALIPDFKGDVDSLRIVADARPDILGHNLETVPRLYPHIRCGADYRRSLAVLNTFSRWGFTTKTSLMLGLGETDDDVLATLKDARDAGVSIVFLGQYLAPTSAHTPVRRYVTPDEFDALSNQARAFGFDSVRAAPLLRSSSL